MRGIADLDAKRATGRCDAEVLVAESADQVEWLRSRLVLCESQRVCVDLPLDRRTYLWRRAKEPVRGHDAVDALMRPLEVVVLDKQLDTSERIREVGKHRLAKKLFPQRFPEPLDLPQRLRMLRTALAMLDAVAAHQLLKRSLASPRRVLSALVRQHLARLPVIGNATLKCFDDQARLLVMRHRPRHQVSRVVVHEAHHVHALMPPQLEREDVRLPELIWFRPFEASLRLVTRLDHRALRDQSLFVKNASHG